MASDTSANASRTSFKIIDRVRKLLQLAKSCNVNEAKAAMAAADKLITEHQISEAQLEASDPSKREEIVGITEDIVLFETGRTQPWRFELSYALSNHYGCMMLQSVNYVRDEKYDGALDKFGRSGYRKVQRYRLIGRLSDIQIIQYFWEYLTTEIERLMVDYIPRCQSRGVSPERLSFCLGATRAIMEKLRADKQSALQLAGSTAMVLINNRAKEAEEAYAANHKIRYVTKRSSAQRVQDCFDMGKRAGNKIQLNSGLGSSTTPKRLGT